MTHTRRVGALALTCGALLLAACGDNEPAAQSTPSSSPASASSSASSTSTPAAPSSTSTTSTPSTTSRAASSSSSAPSSSTRVTRSAAPQVATGRPTRLALPSLGFDQPIRALGLNGGAIDPPPHVVQWYTGSPRPGSTGISVIAGHVAPYGGRPGIFSRLPALSVGDTVRIGYAGGGTRTFRVYAKEAVGKKELQRDARVWGKSDKQVVALITCDSDAPSAGGSSTRNYVVWAAPV